MPICTFKTDDIIRSVEHAINATEWDTAFSEEPPSPRLLFVHDNGVYLMSNGIPRDLIDEQNNYVAYAEGCDPRVGTFDEWYNTSKALVGGDDFVETITVDSDFLNKCGRYENLEIEVSPNQLGIYFANPRRIVRVR